MASHYTLMNMNLCFSGSKEIKVKLDDLCAIKIMGWKLSNGIDMYTDGQWYTGSEDLPDTQRQSFEWNPSTSLDDALICLERAAQGKGYSIYMFPEEKKPYDVELEVFKVCTDAKTLPLAMCICALRAMGVPESEIQEAMK